MKEKEFLYVGYYKDVENRIMLKIGTTNDLKRRQTEHTRNYKKAKNRRCEYSNVQRGAHCRFFTKKVKNVLLNTCILELFAV